MDTMPALDTNRLSVAIGLAGILGDHFTTIGNELIDRDPAARGAYQRAAECLHTFVARLSHAGTDRTPATMAAARQDIHDAHAALPADMQDATMAISLLIGG